MSRMPKSLSSRHRIRCLSRILSVCTKQRLAPAELAPITGLTPLQEGVDYTLVIAPDDSSQMLEGAVFVLQDAKGKRPAITKTTDVDGKALFTDLLYGDYVLEGFRLLQATNCLTLRSVSQ